MTSSSTRESTATTMQSSMSSKTENKWHQDLSSQEQNGKYNILLDNQRPDEPKDSTTTTTKRKVVPEFNPKKFVPSSQIPDTTVPWPQSKTDQSPTTEKIKPKWSPLPEVTEPQYRKIQPILPQSKSPHKIT